MQQPRKYAGLTIVVTPAKFCIRKQINNNIFGENVNIQHTQMNPHIGENGKLVARIVHHDPNVVEAFVQELRVKSGTEDIDWFYIVGTIAIIKAIGDLEYICSVAEKILPLHSSLSLLAVA